MSVLMEIGQKLRNLDVEGMLHLRAPYPPVAVEMERDEVLLVRMKKRRRASVLQAFQVAPLPEHDVPASIFQNLDGDVELLAGRLRELFERTGTRPGRISLVLPDNLAKIALLQLPERPTSPRQLDELVRAKMRRSVPFRLDDAALSYQVLPGDKRDVGVLVLLVRRSVIEHFERAFEGAGARVGLIDIATPNLINLCRSQLAAACREEGDAALLNCTHNYFSLVILRAGRVIFFRCKTMAAASEGNGAPGDNGAPGGTLVREVATSFSYYREKLAGQGVKTVLVRSLTAPTEEIAQRLYELGCETVETIDPLWSAVCGEGVSLDGETGQRIAVAVGAATRGV